MMATLGLVRVRSIALEDPDAMERRGRQLDGVDGLVLRGTAELRRGRVERAEKTFARAWELDRSSFAALLGLGAAKDHDRHRLHRRCAALRSMPPSARDLVAVFPDLPALTELERSVVWASAAPFACCLPRLTRREVAIHVLPIDVRATDVELFNDLDGQRQEDDRRGYAAISGLACERSAIAKIEELLDVASDGGWTFAHELAHLVFFHMSDDEAGSILDIYDRALAVGYASTEYALSNPDEFFAVSYTDYLSSRHGMPNAPIDDDAGVQRALVEYFDGLARG